MSTQKLTRLTNGRSRLLSTAKELFWEQGFESTSPNDIYIRSGVGQGSFYHHFSGKLDLLNAALEAVSSEEIKRLDSIESKIKSPFGRVEYYLSLKRNAAQGCKFGRFTYEVSVEKPEIHDPIRAYFERLERFLVENIKQAQDVGELDDTMSANSLAILITTNTQGGYILSRAHNDSDYLAKAHTAILEMLQLKSMRDT